MSFLGAAIRGAALRGSSRAFLRICGTPALRLASKKAAAAPPPPPKSLAAVLDLELKYEKEEGAGSSEATLAEIQAELADWAFAAPAPAHARFALSKRFGAQEVRLDLDCTPMPADEEDDEGAEAGADGDEAAGGKAAEHGGEGEEGDEDAEAPPDGYRMLVTIKEPGKATTMQVGCFLGRHLRVHRVTLFPAGKEPSSDVIFGGVRTCGLRTGRAGERGRERRAECGEHSAARSVSSYVAPARATP
jgi:hypothetical protein